MDQRNGQGKAWKVFLPIWILLIDHFEQFKDLVGLIFGMNRCSERFHKIHYTHT